MTSSPTPDFGRRAATYDQLRPADGNWREVCETLVREGDLTGRRVLEVGCGTGRFLAALAGRAKVWGIDPSPEMLEVARGRAHGAGLKLGAAEELPFKDAWFERTVMWLVVHLVDRPRAFAELHRVLAPDGRLAIATFDPSYFGGFWLNEYFPSMEQADRARFPSADDLGTELPAVGFEAPQARPPQPERHAGPLGCAEPDPRQAHRHVRPDRRRGVRGGPRAGRARASGAPRLPRRVARRGRRPADRLESRTDPHPFNPVP